MRTVKGVPVDADRSRVSDGPHPRRRAEDVPPAGAARRVLAALFRGLYRTLAEDDDRAAYWLGHVRIGILVSEVASWSVVGYVLLTDSPGRESVVILVLLGLVIVGCPVLLLLPLDAMVRDWRGPTLFYAWSLAETAVVVVVTRLDGGSSSPLDALLFLALTYAAVAYSPYGVVAMGSVMTLSYLFVVELPGITTSGLFFVTIMGSFTLICAMASANSWATHDRQVALIRRQETLASTDPLTGIPNRRAFIDGVTRAVDRGPAGSRTVVCLVDLDGFKAVNDREGHLVGDALLGGVAGALAGAVRDGDTVARLGGDEFAVLARTAPGATAEALAERLRAAVAGRGAAHGVTASVGLATLEPGDDVESVLHRADEAMYRAKSAGGDRADVPDGAASAGPLSRP
jgi:diguanylate cyclase (GGDEF)-like protein